MLKKQDAQLLRDVYAFAAAQKVKLYLVGGFLRDYLLKRRKENPDIDFCLKKNAIGFGRKLSRLLGCGFVVLDQEHGSCRLVKNIKNQEYTLDFTDFRGKDLKEDLRHRDFTINCLSLDLENGLKEGSWDNLFIDLCGSRKDIKGKAIRMANKKSFDEDPLRILRAFSLSSTFDFKIDQETLKSVRLKRNKLADVSSERIREELFKILEADNSFIYLLQMDRLNVLKQIIPEMEVMRGVSQGPYHHLDVLKHSFETVRQLELAVKQARKNMEIRDYLNTVVSGPRKRLSLMKLAAFLHDIGKPGVMRRKDGKTIFHGHERLGAQIAKVIAKRLKLSNDELEALNRMVFWHLRPGYMADNRILTARAKFRFFRDTKDDAIAVLLISLADQRSTRGPLTTPQSRLQHERLIPLLIKEYFRKKKEKKFKRLINGDDLIKKLKLEPGPLIGQILSEIEEMQAVGRLKTKQQALTLAKKIKDRKL